MQPVRRNQALAPGRGQLDERGPGGGDGDLLPDHGPDQQLLRVHRTRHPDAGCGSDAGGQPGIGLQRAVDGDRVGVEIQQPADPAEQGRQVPEVDGADGQHQRTSGRSGVVVHPEAGVAVRQAHGPGVGRGRAFLDTGDGPDCEEIEDARIERLAVGQVQRQGRRCHSGRRGRAVVPRGGPQCRGRHREDLADGLVELADAAEACSEGNVGGFHRCGDQQGARGLCPACPRQRQRSRAELVAQDPVELPRGVAQPGSEPFHAVAVDHTVVDEPHGPSRDVGAQVPGRRAGHGLGQAALAGPVTGVVRGGGGFVEGDIPRLGGPGRAGRPAIDARGPDGGIELPVEPGVAGVDCPVALPEVHDLILPASRNCC